VTTQLTGKRVLITGGAGFIGSNLCEALLKRDNQVVCLDNFVTGKKQNVDPLLSNPKFSLIQGDIRSISDCRKAVKDVDYVLHQAALGSVPRSIKDPVTSNDVNVGGFLNMLVASRDVRVKRFIYAASSSTYGDSELLPKVEDNIGKPLSPYAITKYVNELYADVFSKTYGMETIGLRYFNVYGPRQDPESSYAAVIPKFVSQFIAGESPTVNGNGKYSRDFTYIEDVIQANLLSMKTESMEAINTVYNVAYGEQNTLNNLVCIIKQLLTEFDPKIKEIVVTHGSERIGDIPHSLASVKKAKKLLCYHPNFNLKKGLKEVVKWYWDNL